MTKVKVVGHWDWCGFPQVELEYEDGTRESFHHTIFDTKKDDGTYEVVKKWEDE
jgi:hypothetical protein